MSAAGTRDPGAGAAGSRTAESASLVLACVAVAVAWSIVEVALRGGGAIAIVTALGAGAAMGVLCGVVGVVALHGPTRAVEPWPVLLRGAAAIGVALWLASALGAWAKLGTRNAGLAIAAIGAGVALGALVFAACWAFAPRPDGAPWACRPTHRRLVVAGLVVGAIAASWIDRTVFVGLHAPAHAALRATSLVGLAVALVVVRPPRLRPPLDTLVLGAALVAAAIPFWTLARGADAGLAPLWSTPITDQAIGTLRALTDLDGDGHSGWLGGGDCAPFDPDVHPGAVEVADNGVDDNCADGDATATTLALSSVPTPSSPSPRSVLLVTVETLRADHLGLYGYSRDTTPALQRWAAGARVYDRAFSAGAWTSIAIPSLLRGVQARRLTWTPWAETNLGRLIAPGESPSLAEGEQGVQTFMLPAPDGVPPVSWWLQRRGMTTAAVVDDRFSELLDPSVGTAAGFDVFVDADEIRGRDPDDQVVDLALGTLDDLPRDRPFFLWVHLFGPHSPNTIHDGVPTFGDGLADGYDHEIRFVDAQLDRLLAGATARDPNLAWIVTADHGEVLTATDRMHGFDLSEAVIRVPLVVGGTDLPAGREAAVVSALDLVPTILGLTETPAPPYLDGIDLRAGLRPGRLVLVDTWHRRFDGALLFDHVAATDGAIELVLDLGKNAWGLADFAAPTRGPDAIAAEHDVRPMQAAIRAYLEAPPLSVAP